jgi:chromosomal replication initiator protein
VQGINRKKEIVQARHVSMYFSKCLTKASLSSIGSRTGARNHATVLHACKTIYKSIKENVRFSNQINEIERKLKYSIF